MSQKIKEIEFNKYKRRGDYHWCGLEKSLFRFNAFENARYTMILNQFPKLNLKQKILDVGCGDGVLDFLIKKEKGGSIYGIDSSKEAIEIAKKKFKDLNIKNYIFKAASGYKSPFKDNFFDYVILADVIEHVQKPDQMLEEVKRVIKSGGKIIVSSVVKLSDVPEDKLHVKEYQTEELKSLLEKYFIKTKIIKSHPLFLRKLFQINFKIGKYQPQPFRYFLTGAFFLSSINPFSWPCGISTCQTAVCFKK